MEKLWKKFRNVLAKGPIGIYLMAFFIPLNPQMLGFMVLIIIVEQLLRSPRVDVAHLKAQFTWKNPGIWLFLFYGMHLIGLIHTENMGFAKMDLGMKSTLAIFPVFFFLYKVKVNWSYFVKVFIAGALVSVFVNFGIAVDAYLEKDSFYYMKGEYLSHYMHRGYWAVYLLIATFFLLKMMFEAKRKKLFWINILGVLLLTVFILLSGSKVGVILLFFMSIWIITSLYKRYKKRWVLPVALSVLFIGMFSVYAFMPSVTHRLSSTFTDLSQTFDKEAKENPKSTTARLMLWDSSLELIKENFWLGVGTGDIKDKLIQRNFDKGYVGVAEGKLNSHNQFFNSHIAIGVFGSLFLLLSFITQFLKSSPDKYRAWRIGIMSILFFAMLPESMLEIQAGIIPYAFFISFLPSFSIRDSQ